MPETIEAHPINASDKNSGCCKKNDEEYRNGYFPGNNFVETDRKDEIPRAFSERMDRLRELCDEAAEGIPEELLRELHGGIALTEQVKMHASSDPRKPLYVLGEYLTSYHTGRHIMLYGRSIDRVYGHLPDEELKKELDRIIRHELTHHIESLSGIRDLEVYDEVMLKEYCDELK